jgi:hypothetical protein
MLYSCTRRSLTLAFLLEKAAHPFHQYFMHTARVPWINFLAGNGLAEPDIDCGRAGIPYDHGKKL